MPSDSQVFDEFKLPFIFVPHGAPEPTEWMQRHPDWIKLPATMVPCARSGGRSKPSPPNPSLGAWRSVDGLRASPDPAAPGPPTGNAMSDAMSAGTNETSDRIWISDDPIAAYRQANDALAAAASRYVSDHASASNSSADVGTASLNRTDPPGLCSGTLRGSADANYQVIGSGIASRIPGSYQEAEELSGYATYYNLPGNTTASGQPFDPNGMTAAMTRNRAPLGTNVQVRLQSDPSNSISVQIDDTGPFARDSNGQPLHPLQPDPNIIIDLTPHAFDVLTHNNRAVGRVPVIVTVPDHN